MNSIVLSDSGNDWVNITDIFKAYTDSFSLITNDCNCLIVIPNVFTPNGDGVNDIFNAVINCELDMYRMYIFNRWGKLLWESTDQYEVWDGKYQGNELTEGVYFYKMEFLHKPTNPKEDYKIGSITLLR